MRTLYIILCQTRAWGLTYENMAKNCLDSLSADLALCVGTRHEDTDNPFYRRATDIWIRNEQRDDVLVWGKESRTDGGEFAVWFDEIGQALPVCGDWRKLLDLSSQLLGPIKHGGSGAILLCFRHMLLDRIRSCRMADKYDWFVLSRSDFQFMMPHPPVVFMDPEKIYIPDGERYGGMTDRHIVVHSSLIERVLDTIHDIWTDTDKLHSELQEIGLRTGLMGPENLLLHLLDRHGLATRIKWYPYTMFTVRSEKDGTRWQQGSFNEQLGCYLKYYTEYEQYEKYKDQIVTVEDWRRFL